LLAVDKWRSYLQHALFTIITDHRSLVHLSDQKLTSDMQHKAFVKLMGLQYKLIYRKGKENSAADALSQQPCLLSSIKSHSAVLGGLKLLWTDTSWTVKLKLRSFFS
jgi:hypothetical protein